MPRKWHPRADDAVRHGRKAAAMAPYVDNLRVKLSPWPRYRLVRGEAGWRGNIKRGIILKYGQIKTAGYDLRDVAVVRSGYASTLQTTDLWSASTRIDGRQRREMKRTSGPARAGYRYLNPRQRKEEKDKAEISSERTLISDLRL